METNHFDEIETQKSIARLTSQLEAIDISTQIPASFYTQMESKKWSDRKEALETIERITLVPSITNADFSELIKVLKKTIAKDSNIVVATSAAKCLCQLAQGLRTNFSPYANSCLTILFEKFKEKKPNVISVLRDAADAVFQGTNLEDIHDDVIQFLDNKNPQIKSEIELFLTRVFSNYSTQVRNKKILRPIINALMKTLSDMDATVRDNSAMAIGTAMKVIGENLMLPLIADVEPIKIAKIKEFCEKAEIITAPVNGQNHVLPELANGQQSAPMAPINGVADQEGEDDEDQVYEILEAVDISSQIPANFYTQMESKKWSDRKEALETIEKITSVPKIANNDFNELLRVLKKTIAKDSNIVVATSAAKCLCQLAQGLRTNFSPYANSCLTILFEKFKEKKPNVISVLRDAADAVFVGTNIESIFEDIILFLDNKNPQIKTEMTLFLSRTFSKYPAQVLNKKTLRPIINALIKTLSDMDATVRDNSAMAVGTAMKVTGERLMMTLIADVEPIKIPKIKEFCEKAQVKKIPQAVLNTMNSNNAAAAAAQHAPPTINNHHAAPPPVRSSSATMVRSTASRKLPAKVGSKTPVLAAPGTNATVKRTATIIKRSTVSKRASGLPQPPVAPQATAASAAPAPVQPIVAPTQTVLATPSSPQYTFTAPQVAPPYQYQMVNQTSTPAKPIFASTNSQLVTTPARSTNGKQDNIDMVVLKLISDNNEEVLESLAKLEEFIANDSEHVQSRINQIIDLACLQLIKNSENHETVKKVSNCLIKLFARRQLVSTASQKSIRFLLMQIFTLMQQNFGDSNQENLTNVASAITDGFEAANMMFILTGLLNDPPPSIVEPIKKAIIRSMKSYK